MERQDSGEPEGNPRMERRMSGLAEEFMSSWQSPIFRNKCLAKIDAVRSQIKPKAESEDKMEQFFAQHDSEGLEEFAYNKSKTREDYMALISDLVMALHQFAAKSSANPEALAASAGVKQAELEQVRHEVYSDHGSSSASDRGDNK